MFVYIHVHTTPSIENSIDPPLSDGSVSDQFAPLPGLSMALHHNFTLPIFSLPLPSLQDFALDPDIHRMHLAKHHMVCHLTAGMPLITCWKRLLLSISTNLKATFTNTLRVSQSGMAGIKLILIFNDDDRD